MDRADSGDRPDRSDRSDRSNKRHSQENQRGSDDNDKNGKEKAARDAQHLSQELWKPGAPGQIATSGIDQYKYGDCYFQAAVASMARTPDGAQKLEDMILQNKDGSYTVTFPGDKDNPVTVSAGEVNDKKIRDSSQESRVIEAAFIKYTNYGNDFIKGLAPEGGGIGVFARTRYGNQALQLLTGKNVTTDLTGFLDLGGQTDPLHLATSDSNMKADLTTAMKDGEPATAGCHDRYGPLIPGHEYSVLDFDDKTGTIVLRNPWGDKSPDAKKPGKTEDGITSLGDGKYSMSFDTFTKHFQDLNIVGADQQTSDIQHWVNDAKQAAPGNFGGEFWNLVADEFNAIGL